MKLSNKSKQILSWPFLLIGFYSGLQFIGSFEKESFTFLFLFPGLYLRKDIFNKNINKEYMVAWGGRA
ncbi:MAG: hypothetical protein P8X63_13590, partial [Desulfuromonadaceae bacterium]